MITTDTNGLVDGRIEPGDTLVITFSEALNAASIPTSATVSLTDPTGTGNDTLAITGILSGERTTATNLHITLDATSVGNPARLVGDSLSHAGGQQRPELVHSVVRHFRPFRGGPCVVCRTTRARAAHRNRCRK